MGCALAIAACGPGSATKPNAGTGAAGTGRGVELANCMRAHGVPNFPDPNSNGEIPKGEVLPLVGSPHFEAARRACARLSGGLGPHETAASTRVWLADALAFARVHAH